MKKLIIFLFIFNVLFAYKVIKTDELELIFDTQDLSLAENALSYMPKILHEYRRSFGFALPSRLVLVLRDKNEQTTNGFATAVPFLLQTWYRSGANGMDTFASSSWDKTLALHETTHNFQLSSSSKFMSFVAKFFGAAIPINFYIPFVFYPNNYLPLGFLEGNAVLNESSYGLGGRLFSGYYRANFLADLPKMNLTRFLNLHRDFPFTEEKYVTGAYFFAYLAQKYGLDKTNTFFKTHGQKFLFPYMPFESFKEHFRISLQDEFANFTNSFRPLLKGFATNAKPLLKSIFYSPITRQGNKIIIFTTTAKDDAKIYVFDDNSSLDLGLEPSQDLASNPHKNNQDLSLDLNTLKPLVFSGDFLQGTPFLVDNKPYTMASSFYENVLKKEQFFSLFDKNQQPLEKFNKKIIASLNGGVYYFNNEFSSRVLHKDNKALFCVDSSVFVDDDNVYYFKQNENKRTLMKNKNELTSFSGHYSKVVDVRGENVYFIASVLNGSSLFVFDGNSVKRLFSSGDIVDAKLFNGKFLLAIITQNGYEFVLKSPDLNELENPYYYNYNFIQNSQIFNLNEDLNEDLQKNPQTDLQDLNTTNNKIKSSNYYSPLNIRFYGVTPSVFVTKNSTNLAVSTALIDPFFDTSLGLAYAYLEDKEEKTKEHYLSINLAYKELLKIDYIKDLENKNRGYFLNSVLGFNLHKDSKNLARLEFIKYFDNSLKNYEPNILALKLSTTTAPRLLPFKKTYAKIELSAKNSKAFGNVYATNLRLEKALGEYFHAYSNLAYSKANDDAIFIGKAPRDLQDFKLYDINKTYTTQEIASAKIGLGFYPDLSFYMDFPISLQSLSLRAELEKFLLGKNKKNMQEYRIILDLNTLLIYNNITKISLGYAKNDFKKSKGSIFLGINTPF